MKTGCGLVVDTQSLGSKTKSFRNLGEKQETMCFTTLRSEETATLPSTLSHNLSTKDKWLLHKCMPPQTTEGGVERVFNIHNSSVKLWVWIQDKVRKKMIMVSYSNIRLAAVVCVTSVTLVGGLTSNTAWQVPLIHTAQQSNNQNDFTNIHCREETFQFLRFCNPYVLTPDWHQTCVQYGTAALYEFLVWHHLATHTAVLILRSHILYFMFYGLPLTPPNYTRYVCVALCLHPGTAAEQRGRFQFLSMSVLLPAACPAANTQGFFFCQMPEHNAAIQNRTDKTDKNSVLIWLFIFYCADTYRLYVFKAH